MKNKHANQSVFYITWLHIFLQKETFPRYKYISVLQRSRKIHLINHCSCVQYVQCDFKAFKNYLLINKKPLQMLKKIYYRWSSSVREVWGRSCIGREIYFTAGKETFSKWCFWTFHIFVGEENNEEVKRLIWRQPS